MNYFVTGATAGIGTETVRLAVAAGHRVVACGRRKDRLQKLVQQFGSAVHALDFDVTDARATHEAVSKIPQEIGPIDVLVNNAGLALGLEPAQSAKASDWDQMINTNIKGVLNCTQAILPQMVARNSGHIINIGSVAGEYPYPGGNVYGATKAFLNQLSLNLKADLFGTSVRVTCIEPGMVGDTEFSQVRFKGDVQKAAAVYQGTQSLTPVDVAEVILWVASRPGHVNINTVSLMPVQQSFAALRVDRRPS